MKKLVLLTATAMITSITFAQKIQEKEVPVLVKTSFQNQFPEASDVKWEKEGEKFEVDFELNEIDHSVVFDIQGNILETEVEIELNELPANILDYTKSNYKGKSIKEAAKITDAKGTVSYEVEIKAMDLLFDSSGKFIKENKD